MIVERTTDIPLDVAWTDWSNMEFANTPSVSKIVSGSREIWCLRDHELRLVAVAGVYQPTIIGTIPEFWILIAKDFHCDEYVNLKDIKNLALCLRETYTQLQVKVNAAFKPGLRLEWHS
jgi:hypothetical protein